MYIPYQMSSKTVKVNAFILSHLIYHNEESRTSWHFSTMLRLDLFVNFTMDCISRLGALFVTRYVLFLVTPIFPVSGVLCSFDGCMTPSMPLSEIIFHQPFLHLSPLYYCCSLNEWSKVSYTPRG